MNQQSPGSLPGPIEAFLSGAYRRILRVATVLSVAATAIAARFFGRQAGLGLAVGSLLALLNFVWLHHGSELMIWRMMSPSLGGRRPSKLRLLFAFSVRYALVLGVAYVILKSYPRMLVGFLVGLALPILAAMAEGVYEAVAGDNSDQIPN